jgi:hypothetical protein
MQDIERPAEQPRPGDHAPRPLGARFYILAVAVAVLPGLFVASIFWWPPIDSAPPEAATSSRDAAAPSTPAPDTVVIDDGMALAPLDAPDTVHAIIDAANELVGLPYEYGGGHRPYDEVPLDDGYDGPGATSYALHAAGLLDVPLDTTHLESFGKEGEGEWVTIVVCGSAYLVVGGMAFDSGADGVTSVDATAGPHWRPAGDPHPSCDIRHPDGL